MFMRELIRWPIGSSVRVKIYYLWPIDSYLWARDTVSGPEITISGPEIINFYAPAGPYGPL